MEGRSLVFSSTICVTDNATLVHNERVETLRRKSHKCSSPDTLTHSVVFFTEMQGIDNHFIPTFELKAIVVRRLFTGVYVYTFGTRDSRRCPPFASSKLFQPASRSRPLSACRDHYTLLIICRPRTARHFLLCTDKKTTHYTAALD